MTEIQPSIVTVNILMVTLKEEERKGTQNINSFFISFISDFKISSTSSVVSSTTTSDEIYFNQSVSLLIGFSTEDIKKGALILGGELEFDSENKALQSCLGFGEINLEEASDCYSVLYNKNGRTIGNIQYSINIEPCEDFIEIDKVSNEWNLIEQISHFYDLDPLMNTSNLLLQKTYEQMFQLLHKSNQNQRVLINQQGAVTDISRAKDEFARYKALVEALERRGVADAEAIARLETGSLRDQRLISQLSSSLDSTKQVQALKQSHAGMQEDIKQLSTALAHEREIRESLCAELASLPSNEQLFQTSSDLAFMRARATELHCAMEVVLQYMQVSAGSVEGPDSTAVTQALEAALVSSLRKELEEENQDKARVVFQRDALEKNNKVLAQQVLALLGQLGRTHLEFPMNLEPPDDNLITKEVNAGAVQALAGPTAAAQFATIADLERSLLHFKQLSAHQAERLKFLEASSSPVEGVRASVEDPMEEIAHDNAIIELEAELEDAKNLANLYYEKLQAGSDLLKVQRAQQEQTVADLDAAQNEILLLQQQLAEALMKTISDVEDEDNIDNVNKQRDKSEKVDDSEEVQELNSIIDDLETQLEEAKNLANLYYEKLQAGADYIKQQKAAQEAVEAQLAETQTELVSLREQIAGADQSKMEALSVSVAGEVASRRQLKVLQKEMESTQATIVELESQLSVLRETATLAATTAASPSLADDVPPPHEDSTALLQEKEEALSQLTADLEEAETQLEEMSTTLETYYARLQAGADYTKVLRADLEAVTAERDSFLSMKDSSLVVDGNEDSKLSQVTFELTKATDQIEQLLNGASVYESRMQQNDKKIGELNSEIANLKAERADLLSRLEMLQTEDSPISTTESKEVEKLKLEIITLQGKLQDTTPRESSRDLQRKLDLLERGYVEECAKKDETIEQLMTDLDSAEGRLEELSETMNQYYERLKDGAEHSKKASEETKLISIERDALIAKVIKLEEDITLMKATPIQTPTSSVDKEDHSKFTTKITELESERNIAKQNFKSLQENNANLQKQVTQLEAEIDSLKASIDPFAVSVSTNEDKLSKLSAQIVSAENERDSFKVSVQKLQSDKVALESQIAQLIAELDAIRRDSPSSDNRLKQAEGGDSMSVKSVADVDSMLSDLIEAKMALAHTALELEDERQKSKQLRSQINKQDKSSEPVPPAKKKNFFG